MTFRVSDFQAEVTRRGLARQNRFEVVISNLFGEDKLISLMCQSASFPAAGIVLKSQTLFGPVYNRPGGINYDNNISLTFLVDREMKVKNIFDIWLHSVVNESSFTVNYKDIYCRDVYINQLDDGDNITYSARLIDAFPVNIGAMTLGQANLDRFHVLPVTLTYRMWETSQINNNLTPSGVQAFRGVSEITTFNSRAPKPTLPPEPVDPSNPGAFASAPPGSAVQGGGFTSNLPIVP